MDIEPRLIRTGDDCRTHDSILVLGIGNDILADDGIGPRIIRDLSKILPKSDFTMREELLGGLDLLEIIRGFEKLVLIDAIKTGTNPPGSVLVLEPADLDQTLHITNVHDIGFLTALELGRQSGMHLPTNITILAIEIVEDRIFSNTMTQMIQEKYPDILNEIKEMLLNFNINNEMSGQVSPLKSDPLGIVSVQ
jgi:hydrogenase maturation protease